MVKDRMKIIRNSVVLYLAVASALILANAQTAPAPIAAPHAAPVNTNATPEVRALLKQIDQISGHFTLTGQHNFPNHVSRWPENSQRSSGRTSAFPEERTRTLSKVVLR